MLIKERINLEKVPQHVAVIMDGNGRWATKQGNNRIFGHEHGIDAVRSTVEGAGEIGIEYLTLFAFSTENWSRPCEEVDGLMELLVYALESETDNLMEKNVRVKTIGDVGMLPAHVREKLQRCIDTLENNTGLTTVLALSYSGKWDIINAVRKIVNEAIENNIQLEITNELFERSLSTFDIPNPELLIRTSGEYRISNFLLWQLAYSELYFTEKLWPDFRKDDFFEAIIDFQNRERRFGKTSAQIS